MDISRLVFEREVDIHRQGHDFSLLLLLCRLLEFERIGVFEVHLDGLPDFLGVFDFLPYDVVIIFCVESNQIFFILDWTGYFLRQKFLNSAFDDEEALIAGRPIAENGLASLVRAQSQDFVELVHGEDVSLLSKIFQELVLFEKHVHPLIIDRNFFNSEASQAMNDFLK